MFLSGYFLSAGLYCCILLSWRCRASYFGLVCFLPSRCSLFCDCRQDFREVSYSVRSLPSLAQAMPVRFVHTRYRVAAGVPVEYSYKCVQHTRVRINSTLVVLKQYLKLLVLLWSGAPVVLLLLRLLRSIQHRRQTHQQCSSPFIIFAHLLLSLLTTRNSDPGSQSKLFYPLPAAVPTAAVYEVHTCKYSERMMSTNKNNRSVLQ